MKRYEARTEQYQQNRLFEVNQKKLFEKLEKKDNEEPDPVPERKKLYNFGVRYKIDLFPITT